MAKETQTPAAGDDVGAVSVKIDPLNLDKECIRLPSDYLHFARRAADLRRDMEAAKNELEVLEADLSRRVRADPESFGIEKPTESAISAAVKSQEGYQRRVDKIARLKHEQELAQAVVWALEHKKRALTLLVDLHGMGYFAAPSFSERGRKVVEEMTKTRVRPRRDDAE